ncbi:hypothetical protein CESP606_21375 [Cereibacter sphaeroides]
MQTARPLPCNSGEETHSPMAEDAPRPFCSSGLRVRQMPLQGGPPPDLKDHGSAFADLRTPEIRTSLFSRLPARGLERPAAPRVRPRPHGPASAPAARRGPSGSRSDDPRFPRRSPVSPRPPPRPLPQGQGCAGLSPDRRHMPFGHLGGDRGAPNRKPPPLTARLKESCGFSGGRRRSSRSLQDPARPPDRTGPLGTPAPGIRGSGTRPSGETGRMSGTNPNGRNEEGR